MTGNLRNVLLRLLGGISTLRKLKDSLETNELNGENEQEKQRIEALVDFLGKIQNDTHLFLSGQELKQDDVSEVFINFLTGLSLIQDKRLTEGPAFAVAHIDFGNNDWSQAIREFDSEKEQFLDSRISNWISLIENLGNGVGDQEDLNELNQILVFFEETAKLLEQA